MGASVPMPAPKQPVATIRREKAIFMCKPCRGGGGECKACEGKGVVLR